MTMPPSRAQPARSSIVSINLLIGLLFALIGLAMMLWLGGIIAALVTGHPAPPTGLLAGLRMLAHPGNPRLAWHSAMPGPIWYWTYTGLVVAAATVLAWFGIRWYRRTGPGSSAHPRYTPGLADRADITRVASARTVTHRAATVRPTLTKPRPEQVGYRLGRARGIDVWASVEDSMVILGPPRSGKGLHLVIPMILDAPGPVITTSTRPDNLATTLTARANRGPVAIFDPQQLAPGLASATRWSPVRGCHQPQTAMIRARALAAGTADHVDNSGFWQAQTEAGIRAFLHAAALDDRTAADLYRWSLDPIAAGEAVRILHTAPDASPGWADALDAIIHGDPRTRDNSWAGIRIALSPLADPRVLAAVTPPPGQQFDPGEFLTSNGALYLLGTATGVGAAAGLVAALVEDLVETARRRAARSANARLDPPLALILDEAANYLLPSLPSLISDGGGTGITTIAVLQSLAQARARWGEHDAAAIWDAAIVKIILGGGTNAHDLADLSALIGDRDEQTTSHTRDPYGQHSTSTAIRRVPILNPGRLRTLPFGTGIALLRAAAPILVDLTPWTARADRAKLHAQRAAIETASRKNEFDPRRPETAPHHGPRTGDRTRRSRSQTMPPEAA
jgi:type IV secretory pathway TraG/TraD family ATPase VirD4